jgi:hypothetical protein
MLFLAVFLGFVAENIREGVVENHREKQFMSSLIKDLELDTAELSQGHLYRQKKILALDSLINILSEQNSPNVPLSVFIISRKIYGGRNFFQNSGTLDQLKNAGGLRLIHNRNIVDFIEAYDQQVRRMSLRDDFENEAFVYSSRISEKLFDTKPVIKYLLPNSILVADSAVVIKLNLSYLSEYLTNLLQYEFLIKNNVRVFEENKLKGANLLRLIKKEYHLENE